MRLCTKCDQEYPATTEYFHVSQKGKYGLASMCKKCYSDYSRNRYKCNKERWTDHYKKNRETKLDYAKKYREINIEKIKARDREYYAKNKEQFRIKQKENYKKKKSEYAARAREWRLNNQEKVALYNSENRERKMKHWKEWYKNNSRSVKNRAAKRAAAKKGALVDNVDYEKILKRDDYVCHICGFSAAKEDIHFDHVIPIARGGQHVESNIRVSHGICNLRKNKKLMSEIDVSLYQKLYQEQEGKQ